MSLGIGLSQIGIFNAFLSLRPATALFRGIRYKHPRMRAAIRTEQSRFANIFFCSSGAEANEAAVKLAWKYGKHPCEVPMKFVVKSR